jgi:hypothetical protein
MNWLGLGLVGGLCLTAAACAGIGPGQRSAAAPDVTVQEDLTKRFVIFIGVKASHDPPFLGTPGTNFYCLRSFLDRKTGEVSYQIYVADSYFGDAREWNAAREAGGAPLPFVHVASYEITCEAGCAREEQFAAKIPESELAANPRGLAVTFTARSGREMTVRLSPEQITAQLAAVAASRRNAAAAVGAAQ